MARPRRRKQSDRTTTNYPRQRVHIDPIERVVSMLARPYRPIFDLVESFQTPTREVLDLPDYRPATRGRSRGYSVTPSQEKVSNRDNHLVEPLPSFPAAGALSACVQRHQRREVLHALKLTGKGARARRRRRNAYSGVSC